MSQFKVGDLALTLVDRGWPAMTTVELVQLFHPGDKVEQIHKTSTAIEDLWECESSLSDKYNYLYRPSELMPLRGDFTPERQKDVEVPA